MVALLLVGIELEKLIAAGNVTVLGAVEHVPDEIQIESHRSSYT